ARRRATRVGTHRQLPALTPGAEAVDARRQSACPGGGSSAALDVRVAHVRAHAVISHGALRGDGAAVPLSHTVAAATGTAADGGEESGIATAARFGRPIAQP